MKNLLFHIVVFSLAINFTYGQTRFVNKNKPPEQTIKSENDKKSALVEEGFDKNIFPPTNWEQKITNEKSTWFNFDVERKSFTKINPKHKFSAVCPYSKKEQNEWLYTSLIDISGTYQLSVEFYSGHSHYWLDSANVSLFVSNNKGESWDSIWSATDTASYSQWKWRKINIDLYDYANDSLNRDTLKFAFRYKGRKGDLMAIDDFKIIGGGLSKKADITAISIPNQIEKAIINQKTKQVHATILSNPDLKILKPKIEISRGATISPSTSDSLNYSYSADSVIYNYTVTAANQTTTQNWLLIVKMAKPSIKAEIIDIKIPGQTAAARIDTVRNRVAIEVEYDAVLKDIEPIVSLSPGAKSELKQGEKITIIPGTAFSLKIYPQDPYSPSQIYTITVTNRTYMNDIISFSTDNEINHSHIDTANHIIIDTVFYESNLSELNPQLSISPGATMFPTSENIGAFESGKAKNITISAANGEKQIWQIFIIKDLYMLFEENFDNISALKINKWQTQTNDTISYWKIKKQSRNPFSNINPISKYSLLHQYTKNYQQDRIISDTISTYDVTNLSISFFTGYNPYFTDSAGVKLYIIDLHTNDTINVWNSSLLSNKKDTVNWRWEKTVLRIDNFINKSIKIAYSYYGNNGDLIGIDDIKIYDESDLTDIQSKKNIYSAIKIFPNPCKDYIFVESPIKISYLITNELGVICKQGFLYSETKRINLSGLKNGIYFIVFQDINKNTESYKIIISK